MIDNGEKNLPINENRVLSDAFYFRDVSFYPKRITDLKGIRYYI